MDKYTLKAKFIMVLLMPACLSLCLAGFLIYERIIVSNEVKALGKISQIASISSQLIHELQKERGISSIVVVGLTPGTQSKLLTQRGLTDKAFLNYQEMTNNKNINVNVKNFIQKVDEQLDQLNDIRKSIDDSKINGDRVIEYYSTANSMLLNLMSTISDSSTSIEMANLISGYVYLTRAKEQAGIERALLSNYFTIKKIYVPSLDKLNLLLNLQNTYLDLYVPTASDEQLTYLDEIESTVHADKVNNYRRIALSYSDTQLQSVDPLEWLSVSTKRINDFYTLEGLVADRIQKKAIEQKNKAMLELLEIVLFVLILTLIGSVITYLIYRNVISRAVAMANAMEEIAEGDGNLSRRLDEGGKDAFSRTARAFNKFVNKIQGVVDLVLDSSINLSNEAGKMSDSSSKTHDQVVEQQQAINKAVIAVNNMANAMDEINENVNAAAEAAQQANNSSSNGEQVVKSTVNSIHELASEVGSAASIIDALYEESQQIDDVVSIIKDISDQTNLLSLNAAIEAARAGEAGRGFAVVADEVRALSKRTHDETSQIQSIIGQLRDKISHAVKVMSSGNDKATASVSLAENAGSALDEITNFTQSITDMNIRIAETVKVQTENTADTSQNIESIRAIADETSSIATSSKAVSNELNIMANQMHGLVSQFLLNNVQNEEETKSADSDIELF